MTILLVGGSVMLARRSPVPRRIELLHLDVCEFPCWIGIVPGETTLSQAEARLHEVYAQESDIRIIKIVDTDEFSIYSPSIGTLVNVYLLPGENKDAPISELVLNLNEFRLNEIYRYLPHIENIAVWGNWFVYSPKWSLQGMGPRYGKSCAQNIGIKAHDYAVTLTLVEPKHWTIASLATKWQGFRSCYPRIN
jgi:hypothetical protein